MTTTIEQLEKKQDELTDRFNQLLQRLSEAKIKSVLTFDDLEMDQDFDDNFDIDEEEPETIEEETKATDKEIKEDETIEEEETNLV